jgi:hypothetical protein
VIVLWFFPDREHHADLRIEAVHLKTREIGLGVEDEPVGSCRQWLFKQKEGLDSPLFVGPGMGELLPTLITVLAFKIDGYSIRRFAARCVKNMG